MRRFRILLLLVAAAILVGEAHRRLARRAAGSVPGARAPDAASVSGPSKPEPTTAKSETAGVLFAFAVPANAAALTQALPAPARTVRYVRIDRDLVEGKTSPFWIPNGTLDFPRPSGGALKVMIDRAEMLGPDRFSAVGHIVGQPLSRAVFAYNRGFLSASVEAADQAYALRPATETLTQYFEVDPARVGFCGGVRHAPIPPPPTNVRAVAAPGRAAQAEAASPAMSGPAARTVAAATSTAPVVDVMIVYTQAVKMTMTGSARVAALQTEFDAAIAKMNAELAASQAVTRVRLVKIMETTYAADGPSNGTTSGLQDAALTALYQTNDGQMDEIHAARDRAGADAVCLVLNRADPGSIGLSFLLDTPATVNPAAGPVNPLYAFAVVQDAMVGATDVVSHELGHILGCAHARGDPGALGTKDGAYTYSYGYRFYGTNGRQYHDIMAYSPGSPLSYYSNPNVTVPGPVNAAIGIDPGQTGESDCALTIDQDAFEVSNYRLQTQQASSGILVDVATRALVGTGNQVLIGGFVVQGTEPKQMLIRAAGPALGAFGVTDAIARPTLEVYSGSTLLAQNTGWGNQAGAAAVSTAATQAGAFAFAPGSADDALLLTLSPGGYSAIVQGSGGTTGSGMVEVYDVNRAGDRIVNLSTRGYADDVHPMIGGFVVQGAPGTTKRILVRVLGPTLARDYGIADAMYDPVLELHDSSTALLLKNDDWSSGDVSGTANATTDFQPWVKTYGEQQIFATGFAPPNRREPCILMDLPPGAYSAVVVPFENLSRNPPNLPQPGVAIVEVYEIQ